MTHMGMSDPLNQISLVGFFSDVYTGPLLSAVPATAFAWWLHSTVLPGVTWMQLAMAGLLIGVVYYGTAFFFVVAQAHRNILHGWVGRFILNLDPRKIEA